MAVCFLSGFTEMLGRGFTTFEHVETLVRHRLRGDLNGARMRELAANFSGSDEAVTTTLIARKRLALIAESRGAFPEDHGADTINPLIQLAQRAKRSLGAMFPAAYEGPLPPTSRGGCCP